MPCVIYVIWDTEKGREKKKERERRGLGVKFKLLSFTPLHAIEKPKSSPFYQYEHQDKPLSISAGAKGRSCQMTPKISSTC